MSAALINPNRALIFRITHIANLPWLLDHGLHCRNSAEFDPNFINIGNPDLIARRQLRHVPVPPGGTLSDYVPFYFTPYSLMLFNIKTGYGGVPRQPNDHIVILVSSLRKAAELGPGSDRGQKRLNLAPRSSRAWASRCPIHRNPSVLCTHCSPVPPATLAPQPRPLPNPKSKVKSQKFHVTLERLTRYILLMYHTLRSRTTEYMQ